MPQEVRLWSVGPSEDSLSEVPATALDLEEKLERWIERSPSILSPGLLVIGRQVPTDFGGFIDLLCLDAGGNAVVVELKRDKTPREVTAQVLDYASWVQGLSNDSITAVANQYLGARGPLEDAFSTQFGSELPDTLNETHRMLIVGSRIDQSTERIVHYLSETHGVNINAVRFEFFSLPDSSKLLARVFLIEPEKVEYQSRTNRLSKRRASLSREELEASAEDVGIGDLYRAVVDGVAPLFDGVGTTQSSLGFLGGFEGGNRIIFSLLPSESSKEKGLYFQIYWKRACDYFGLDPDSPGAVLPENRQPWAFRAKHVANLEWSGYSGFFSSPGDVERFVKSLRAASEAREPVV